MRREGHHALSNPVAPATNPVDPATNAADPANNPAGGRDVDRARRLVLRGLAAASVLGGAGLLAACGSDDKGTESSGSGSLTEETPTPTEGGGSAEVIAKTADVPVGGGIVAGTVVVTQPTAGEFKAFTSKCTHMGCQVGQVAGRTINCPCHGSKFNIADGSVANGPAPTPLPEVAITVEGEDILRA